MIVVLINSLLMCCKNCVMIKIKRGLPFCVEENNSHLKCKLNDS